MHVLAACVDRVVIVRRDRDRERPVEAILHGAGRCADGHLGPDLHLARLTRAFVEPLHGSAEAAKSGAGRPDDVVVHRIGNRPSALAAGDRVPHAARDWTARSVARLSAETAVARTTRGWSVLPVAIDVVGDLIVGGDVI